MTKILVAEDERSTRLIIKRILEKEGYEVVEASDGSSALETAALHKPELILFGYNHAGDGRFRGITTPQGESGYCHRSRRDIDRNGAPSR